MYRPALALLLCFHTEVKNPWNEEQDSCLPQLPPFNWKMKQCHVEGRKFGLCASQQELLLSSTPLPCCWQPILPNQPGEHWPGCLSVWLHPGPARLALGTPLPALSSPATWATLCFCKAQQLPWALSKALTLRSPFTL